MTPLVKICGVRRVADARLAEELGANFIGCVLAVESPRCATLAEVKAIAGQTQVPLVLVFRRPTLSEVLHASLVTSVRRVQVHGGNEADYQEMTAQGLIVHRVYSVDGQLPEFQPTPTSGCPALLDVGGGGTGCTFDWSILGEQAPPFTFVAGGITPNNIGGLLSRRPYGVDLSSGIELEPGIKDSGRMYQLFEVLGGVR